ncbi:hypothetical protein DFH06DRAFT_1072788 [Mycena polygramma]|nr:hypothetical protein DFH06DRAFT_1072788 [Mycena polygramma]
MSPRPPCVFFLQNTCTFGDACRNPHAKPPDSLSPTPPICAHFLRGRCRFGDQCREFHPSSNLASSAVEGAPTKPPCHYFTRASCIKGENCPFSHEGAVSPVPEANRSAFNPGNVGIISPQRFSQTDKLKDVVAPTKPRPCQYFNRGSCMKGNNCTFSHESGTASPAPAVDVAPTTPRPCQYFSRGSCMKGSGCPFSHEGGTVLPVQAAAVALTTPRCQYFSRGSCMMGSNCTFSHESPEVISGVKAGPIIIHPKASINDEKNVPVFSPRRRVSEPMREHGALEYSDDVIDVASEGLDAYSSIDRAIYHCDVQFGAGASVLQVITPFESRRVLISNIPASASDSAISEALSRLTTSADLQIHRSPLTALATASLVFPDASSAAQAASSVAAISVGGNPLSGQLDLRAYAVKEEGKGVVRSTKVKVTWYGRRGSAFVHYLNARSAEEHAQRLNGKSYHGYTLSASYRKPTPPPVRINRRFIVPSTQLHTVMLRNLPLVISKIELQQFCDAESVAVDAPRCPADSPSQMRRVLEEFGPVDAFDTLPMTKATAKMVAFAQFQDASAAAAAELALRATAPSFLGRTPFFIERTFSVKYSVRQELFTKIQGTLDLLAGLHPSMIRCYLGENPNEPVIVVLHGSEPKALGRVKAELDRIVQGELLVVEGQKCWDDFFDSVEGQAFLGSLNASEDVFIRCDTRTRTLRLFGGEADRIRARDLILEKLVDVHSRRHVFPLRKDLIRLLLREKMQQLKESLGADRLVLNVVARTLTVNGDESDLRRVRAELAALESGKLNSATATTSDVDCPVCFCTVEDPVRLGCGHLYCKDCLQHYLRPAPQDPGFSPKKCVAEVASPDTNMPASSSPCALHISYQIIRSLLTSAEEDSLLHASFLSHINEHPADFRYCPSPDCQTVYRPSGTGTAFQCPSCLIHICPTCNVEYHDGMTCAEHQDNLTGGLAALAKWREMNGVKQCPNCHADIEKTGGCNHMTCFFCKTHICWVCLKTFSDQGNDGGIYPHMQREHGGMYV